MAGIIQGAVSFTAGDATIPTVVGYTGGVSALLEVVIGYLEAHISAESAIGGMVLSVARMAANKISGQPAADVLDIVAEEDV